MKKSIVICFSLLLVLNSCEVCETNLGDNFSYMKNGIGCDDFGPPTILFGSGAIYGIGEVTNYVFDENLIIFCYQENGVTKNAIINKKTYNDCRGKLPNRGIIWNSDSKFQEIIVANFSLAKKLECP